MTFAERIKNLQRGLAMARIGARAVASKQHTILVHMVPMRRCNLACGYCNEYDQISPPVPTAVMLERIDLLSAFSPSIITLSGGEPLLHPDLDVLIRHIRSIGTMPELLTNGFLLSPDRIKRLNEAGLSRLQISIDNVKPDSISQKSLKTLDRKLEHLAAHADFMININSVVGAGDTKSRRCIDDR